MKKQAFGKWQRWGRKVMTLRRFKIKNDNFLMKNEGTYNINL